NLDALLTVLKLRSAETPCIILSSNVTSESTLRLLQLGASDVIARDEFTCELPEVQIRRAMESLTLSEQLNAARKRLEGVSISTVSPKLAGITIPNDHEQTLEVYTMGIIRHFLGKYNNNVVLVARKLGVGKSTIYRYIKENKLTLTGEPYVLKQKLAMSYEGYDIEQPADSSDIPASTAFQAPLAPSLSQEWIDLNYLKRISRGDRFFMQGMMNVFFRTMDGVENRLRSAHAEGDKETMLDVLGAMKSPADSMGMHLLRRLIDRVEKDIVQGGSPALIGNQLEDLCNVLGRSVDALRKERSALDGSGF
ncbi:MAG: hypothetical protein ACKO1U_00685, partial [Bacteroidota bacterium]